MRMNSLNGTDMAVEAYRFGEEHSYVTVVILSLLL